ncbi:MAG: hypothetical protein ACI837_000701 [Crocinitomicaceae bacterium]|jgi:hypothetical protein
MLLKRKPLILILFFGLSSILNAQNPSDGCAGVPALTVNAVCTPGAYTLPVGYSNGALLTASCFAAGNDRDDGWYSITAGLTGTMYIDATGDEGRTLAGLDHLWKWS